MTQELIKKQKYLIAFADQSGQNPTNSQNLSRRFCAEAKRNGFRVEAGPYGAVAEIIPESNIPFDSIRGILETLSNTLGKNIVLSAKRVRGQEIPVYGPRVGERVRAAAIVSSRPSLM